MRKVVSIHFNFINRLLTKRYRALLLSLICMLIVPAFFEGSSYQSLVSFVLNSLVIYLSIYSIQESKKQLYVGLILATVVIFINQFGIFENEATYDFYLSFFIYLLFFTYLAYRLLRMILATDSVTVGVLYAAVLVYILMGVVGGYLYMLIENAFPGSIVNLELENLTDPTKFFYFSFITLSTLGYGDIYPHSAPARSLSMVLSTAGPLYLTILIALLVSRFEHANIK